MNDQMQIVLTTLANEHEAQKLSEMLINRRLVACTQEFPVHSRFRWEGAVQSESEIVMLLKTATDLVDAVVEAIKSVHSYEVPEIIVLPVTDGLPAYLSWVREETRGH